MQENRAYSGRENSRNLINAILPDIVEACAKVAEERGNVPYTPEDHLGQMLFLIAERIRALAKTQDEPNKVVA
jgi:hypothetical protein